MFKTVVGLACVLGLATASRAQVAEGDLQWGPAPPGLPPGSQAALLAGDPAKPGVFTIRARLPAGYVIAPHHHPSDEHLTIISGEMAFGMGDKVDPAKAKAMTAGAFVTAHAGMNHFVTTKDGAEIQVTAQGPFEITYVNPADDPRKKP